jgi:hypothetical protein
MEKHFYLIQPISGAAVIVGCHWLKQQKPLLAGQRLLTEVW